MTFKSDLTPEFGGAVLMNEAAKKRDEQDRDELLKEMEVIDPEDNWEGWVMC